MDLLADDALRPLVVLAALEALQALVPDPQRLVLQVDLNVARHVHLGRLPYQDLWRMKHGNPYVLSHFDKNIAISYREPDEVLGLLLAGVVKVLHPEVEDLLLRVQLRVLRTLPELGDQLDVADGRFEVPENKVREVA